MNIASILEQNAQLFPERLALDVEGEHFTYAELDQASGRAANVLVRMGVQRGNRVAIWLPNSTAFILTYLGAQKIGATAVTINTALTAEEIQYILADSGARLLITTEALYKLLVPEGGAKRLLADVTHVLLTEGIYADTLSFSDLFEHATAIAGCTVMEPEDVAVILYTSGTTGFPKGALISHGAAIIAIQTVVQTLGLSATDRVLLPLALFHSFGQTAAWLPTIAAGATLFLHRQFDPQPVLASIAQHAITIFFGVPTIYILLKAQSATATLNSVRCWLSAGAPLPMELAQQWQSSVGVPIQNGYGLTETFLVTFNAEPLTKPGSVGTPLPGVAISIVDSEGVVVPIGERGEVVIATPSLMLGYWQRPHESAAVLRDGRFHTGDVGQLDSDGYLYIVDRIKDMINVGGVKVYSSEIEHIFYQHPAVLEVAVFGVPEPVLGEQVHASIVLKPDSTISPQALILFCSQHLAAFKLPSTVHIVEQLPKSRTGKILKRILRDQVVQTMPAVQLLRNARGEHVDAPLLSRWMVTWLAEQLHVEAEQIDPMQPFAELGLTSVMAINFTSSLGAWLGRPLQAIMFWNFPTIDAVVQQLLAEATSETLPNQVSSEQRVPVASQGLAEPVALIGIGCRMPGRANTPDTFWQLLRDGVDTVAEIPASRWDVDAYYDPRPNVAGKIYVRAGSFLEDIDRFDAPFFGITALEAASMDPQQRLLLEVSWEALEHANLLAGSLQASRTGVYVGAFWDDYSVEHLYRAAPDQIDSYRLLSSLRGMMAGRIAYLLGLHGPAMQVDTACSSALLAVHLACQALRTGECDLALAGGVNLLLRPEQLIGLCQMGAVSPDGRCKTFAAGADGFGVGEGAGMIVLKRLTDAVSDGDQILAVIRGSAVNHDGASNGLTAPNGRAQELMLRQALANANVRPEQIQYIETHGTGTALGDPIEVQAILNVLGGERSQPLWIGSVKSNIGHLSAAAGIAALIKVVLSLQAGAIPPNLHFTTPNPHIPWEHTPLAVPVTYTEWPAADRRLAGVSSFGLSGTNVHLIVEAAPVQTGKRSTAVVQRPYHLLTLSARSEPALVAQMEQMEQLLALPPVHQDGQHWLGNLCYTAATRRTHWNHRLSLIAADPGDMRTKLRQAHNGAELPAIMRRKKADTAPQVAFLFAGQGPQYASMGHQLYTTQPLFRQVLEQCDAILRNWMDQPLLEILYGSDPVKVDTRLNEATYAQPALFSVEYALACLWRSWGIEPVVLLGHSLGEYAAACMAGVFSLEDGLKLVATRGRLMQEMAPRGQMVAVLGGEVAVRHILAPYADRVALAAINTPQSLVIAGDVAAIEEVTQELQQAGMETRPLKIYVASHSPLMEPILEAFSAVAHRVTYQRPRLRVVSNVTGLLADEQIATPDYWCRHLREPVQFARGIATLAELGVDTLIETGPKATLLGLGQQCLPEDPARLWLRSMHPQTGEWQQLLESLALLHGRGATIDWHSFDRPYNRTPITLPFYPFQRQRYWLDDTRPKFSHPPVEQPSGSRAQVVVGHPLLGRQVVSVLAARNQELLFEGRIDLAAQPYLADHTLFEQIILPGASYLEMALAASAQLWPQHQAVLADCAIQQGLFLPSSTPAFGEAALGATLQVVLTPRTGGYQWQVYSLADGESATAEWTLHATGSLLKPSRALESVQPEHVDRHSLLARCSTTIDMARFEQSVQAQGIIYGPQFQAVRAIYLGEDEALGELVLPQPLQADAGRYSLHPVLLDAALRISSSLLPSAELDPYLPFSLERLELSLLGNQTRLWSYVQRRFGDSRPDSHQVDLTLFNEVGEVVARLTNFTLRRASRQLLLSQQRRQDWLYELAWKPVDRVHQSSFNQQPGRWLILADQRGYGAALAARLEAHGAEWQLYTRPSEGVDLGFFQQILAKQSGKLRGVVFLWGVDAQEIAPTVVPDVALQLSSDLLSLVQAVLQRDQLPRLWLITQQAAGPEATQLQQAPLWGIGRTLHWEQPELDCTCVDLSGAVSAQALFDEIWMADGENQIVLRGEERRVARLVRHHEPVQSPLVLDPQGSYLVTGGLGGLGLQTARWLVERGARRIILAGRHGVATEAVRSTIQTLVEAGARVEVVQADVGQQADVERLLAVCQAVAPLRGVIHAAGAIDDGMLQQQTAERLQRVMATKVMGSWHLHMQTLALPLDFFVCFSSIASLLGNSGQSNYAAANAFMDVLAQQRRRAGQPALTINWGGWSEVGLAAELVKATASSGMGAIAPVQGLDLLGVLMTHQAPQVGVLPIQWRSFEQTLTNRAALPVLNELLGPVVVQQRAPTSLRQQLAEVDAAKCYALLNVHVQELVRTLLGKIPDEHESFLQLGLDSLMSIQLANRLARALDLALPATLAFNYETVDRLTDYLFERLALDAGRRTESAHVSQRITPPGAWYPQLYNQRECYLWHEAAANKACMHIQQSVYIHSPVDRQRLQSALQVLVDRHEALRTVYTRQGDDLLQRILPAQRVDVELVEVGSQPWSAMVEAILAAAREPFNLAEGPLLRGRLYSRTANDHLFLFVIHHIAADATALSLLVRELWELYGSLETEAASPLPTITTTWSDFVRWQNNLLLSEQGARLWSYWQEQMRGCISQINLPTDFPRPTQDTHHGSPCAFELDAQLTWQLRQVAQREACTLYMVLMAGFQLLLYAYTRQRDLLVAAHVANRNDLAFADLVGYLADTIPIRAQIAEDATFQSLLHQTQKTILSAMDHQGLPMRLLAERLGVEGDPSQTVLCQVWFTLLPLRLFQDSGELFQTGAGAIERGGLVLEAADLLPAWLGAWYDLEMILTEGESVVFGTLVYKSDLFVESTIRQMIVDYCSLLAQIVADPAQLVTKLSAAYWKS